MILLVLSIKQMVINRQADNHIATDKHLGGSVLLPPNGYIIAGPSHTLCLPCETTDAQGNAASCIAQFL